MLTSKSLWAAAAAAGALFAAALAGCGGTDKGAPPVQSPQTPNLAALIVSGSAQSTATLVGDAKCAECHSGANTTQRHVTLLGSLSRQAGRAAAPPDPFTVLQNPPPAQPNATPGFNYVNQDIHGHWEQTIHAKAGVTCESCHGPGSAHAANPTDPNAIIGFPRILSPLVCGQCHNAHTSLDLSEFNDWSQSPHRTMVETVLEESVVNGTPASSVVQTCFRCHNGVLKAELTNRGISPGSLNTSTQGDLINAFAYLASEQAEGTDSLYLVATANCATCHDPHSPTGNAKNTDGDDSQVLRALFVDPTNTAELSKIGPGTTPDQYTSLNHNCGQCHNGRGANPTDTALQTNGGTARPSMHDSNQFNMLVGEGGVTAGAVPARQFMTHALTTQQCATCHMAGGQQNLETHTFTVKLDACQPCHTINDAANRRVAVQDEITQRLLNIQYRLQHWAATNSNTAISSLGVNGWEYSTQGGPSDQSVIPIQIKRARYNYYFVVRDKSFGVHNSGYTRFLLDVADAQLTAAGAPPTPTGRAVVDLAAARAQLVQMTRSSRFDGFSFPID